MESRPRIAHVITRLDLGGSADCTVLTVLGTMGRFPSLLVHGPTVVPTRYLGRLREQGGDIVLLPALVRNLSPRQDLRALLELVRLFRREQVTLVHTHTSKAGVLGRLAALFAGCPVIVHTPHGHVFTGYFSTPLVAVFVVCERVLAPFTDRIVTLTRQGIEEHLERGIGRREQYTAIHSGIVLEEYRRREQDERREARAAAGFDDETVVLGWVGRLEPIKDPLTALLAFARVAESQPAVHLVMVGDGPLEAEIHAFLTEHGLEERVHLWTDRPNASEVFALLDLFLLTSRNEGMGRVLVEAMLNALPVVATRVGGVSEVVEHGSTGWLVGPGDVEGLVARVLTLVRDVSLRRRFGEAGRLRAQSYSDKLMVEDHLELYVALLEGVPNRRSPVRRLAQFVGSWLRPA